MFTFIANTYAALAGFGLTFLGNTMFPVWIGLMPVMIWLNVPSYLSRLVEVFDHNRYAAPSFGARVSVTRAQI